MTGDTHACYTHTRDFGSGGGGCVCVWMGGGGGGRREFYPNHAYRRGGSAFGNTSMPGNHAIPCSTSRSTSSTDDNETLADVRFTDFRAMGLGLIMSCVHVQSNPA